MKAVLVIDMPADCIKCPLADGYCWNMFPAKGRADGCPLKLLRKKTPYGSDLFNDYVRGYNDCIDDIIDGKK